MKTKNLIWCGGILLFMAMDSCSKGMVDEIFDCAGGLDCNPCAFNPKAEGCEGFVNEKPIKVADSTLIETDSTAALSKLPVRVPNNGNG